MDIVSWTFANDKYDQDKPLYVDSSDPSRSLSAKEARTLVKQLVVGFHHHGLGKGDCVCVISFNEIHYTSLYLGIIGAGGIFTGANPGYTSHELAHHLRITEARLLITQPAMLATVATAADECGIPRSNIFVLNTRGEYVPTGYQSWTCLLQWGERNWVSVEGAENTPAAYASTSGTSGPPKAAILPHSYMVSQAEFLTRESSEPRKVSYLVALPPFHSFIIPIQHATPLRQGIPCYIMPRFELQSFVHAIERFQISRTVLVPPILMALSKSSLANTHSLRSLCEIFVGGSCTGYGLQQQLYEKLSPAARILNTYGMTETGWATTAWQDRKRDTTGSVGKPLPGTKLRILDKSNHVILKDNVCGELHIQASYPMKAYLHNPLATTEAFTSDSWIRSGDIGYVRNGRYYLVDRTKDLIKVRGWQVSPAEIEAVLAELEGVVDAAVIGVRATSGNGVSDESEVPLAFVVRKQGSGLGEVEVKTWLGKRLARYKMVQKVVFVDVVPRNPTGKILRRILRETVSEEKEKQRKEAAGQEVAQAYAKALRDLEEARLKRGCGVCSRQPSLSNTSSTARTSEPTTPPLIEVMPPAGKNRKRRHGDHAGAKQVVEGKRRKTRAVVMNAVKL